MTRWGMSRAGTREALGSRLILMAKFLPMAVPGRPGGSVMTIDRPVRPLLTVKQLIPPVRPGAVRRARLEQRLRDAETGLTIVVAPAGWGKTSLLSQWAIDPGERVHLAWVSLDDSDDEPTRFWSYVLTALCGASDEISTAPLDALAVQGADPIDLALPILLNELVTSKVPHVLVLDDFHVLADPRIQQSIEFLVTYLPASLRLVIAGRADPPLPIARMRARGELTELRAADLRLSPDEAATLVSAVSGSDLDDAEAKEVWDRTEGWAAGLQLAGLARRGSGGTGLPTRVRGDDRHLLDYFASEVLPAITSAQRDLLVRAAPLERLSGSLCDTALQVTGSDEVLRSLDRADLFLVALDAEHRWFRCHHLFRDVLRRDPGARSAADSREVLRRAAAWFELNDQIDEAVRHLLQADDAPAASALLESSEPWFFERGAAATYLMLGEQLPQAQISAQLAVVLAYAAATSGRLDRVPHLLDICNERIAPDTVIRGWGNPRAAELMMRAVVGTPDTESARAVDLCRQAVEVETAAGGNGLPIALASLGSALARDGQFPEAVDVLLGSWRERDHFTWSPGVTLQVGANLGLSLLELGRRADLDAFLREALPLADRAEQTWGEAAAPVIALLRTVQGRNLYQQGEAAQAGALLARAVWLAEVAALPTTLVLALVFLADAELGCGDRVAARAALARARDNVDDEPVTPLAMRLLQDAETRIGRVAVRSARRSGALAEELTDRELSILRALPGTATQREIGQAMFLSVNTVKAYNKSLYRKLGVASRSEAVAVARDLGVI
jgi:LuxR family maltose regulon positive regulatory protein